MPSNGYFSILYKMLEKHLWNSFLLYLVVEILQLVHKIAVSPRCSIKEPSKHLFVFKTSWRHLQYMSWRCLQHVFSITIFRLPRRLEDALRRRLQDVFKTSWNTENCYAEDFLKTSWKQANLNVYIFDLANLHLTNLYLTNLRRIQNALIRT